MFTELRRITDERIPLEEQYTSIRKTFERFLENGARKEYGFLDRLFGWPKYYWARKAVVPAREGEFTMEATTQAGTWGVNKYADTIPMSTIGVRVWAPGHAGISLKESIPPLFAVRELDNEELMKLCEALGEVSEAVINL